MQLRGKTDFFFHSERKGAMEIDFFMALSKEVKLILYFERHVVTRPSSIWTDSALLSAL